MDINEIKNFENINVIDIREKNEYDQMHIPNTKNIPMMGLIANHTQFLSKNEKYYIMCLSGGRSHQVVAYLKSLGYDVVDLKGGISSYKF
ncbi:MAG: rhodanese-like domain-containing protein [Bacilli bacterium]